MFKCLVTGSGSLQGDVKWSAYVNGVRNGEVKLMGSRHLTASYAVVILM